MSENQRLRSAEPTNERYAIAKIAGIKLRQVTEYGGDFISDAH